MSTSWLCRSVRSVKLRTSSESAARRGRGARLERVLAVRLAGEEVLDEHDAVLRARDDVEQGGHGRNLLALLLEEPVHELLGDEIHVLARRDRELLDLPGDALLLVERELDRLHDVA